MLGIIRLWYAAEDLITGILCFHTVWALPCPKIYNEWKSLVVPSVVHLHLWHLECHLQLFQSLSLIRHRYPSLYIRNSKLLLWVCLTFVPTQATSHEGTLLQVHMDELRDKNPTINSTLSISYCFYIYQHLAHPCDCRILYSPNFWKSWYVYIFAIALATLKHFKIHFHSTCCTLMLKILFQGGGWRRWAGGGRSWQCSMFPNRSAGQFHCFKRTSLIAYPKTYYSP